MAVEWLMHAKPVVKVMAVVGKVVSKLPQKSRISKM